MKMFRYRWDLFGISLHFLLMDGITRSITRIIRLINGINRLINCIFC